ncbi:MAG: hypothetical protein RBS47_11965 [Hydrogenophaga sp.]|jgi:hypothetical protein|uniref:hypothetical protein n=1 Tax=Hydrogenophaga sp. TaxID=1904254 RepID=UPI002A36D2D3|nr:hypothetical protein [Hydrogenophaga sp.]MDX9969731.1 hypothetical protein [Hydrogenophaga sp.]
MSDDLAGRFEEVPMWPEGRFQGREAFAGLVRQAAVLLAREKCSPVVFSDADFSDWPLGERAVVEALHAWAGQGRAMRWLARDFRAVRQAHPRLVQWRGIWSHIVEARACPVPPSAIWTPAWAMERIDPERCVVVATADTGRCQALRERIDACWERGMPSFPASVLGL